MNHAGDKYMLVDIPLQPGATFVGKYRIERILGRGGMGLVFAARHLELGQLFAIKLLLPHALQSDQAIERFLREARAAARLKSQHLTRVHDVGRLENGAPYMVMEHLEGTDLSKTLRERGPLPLDEAILYIVQACEALAEAHAEGIIHRDIKPANLFLTRRRNGSPCIKVLDFGVAKEHTDPGLELTQTGMAIGSPLYMAPEQMAHAASADPRSDIWAMGVVLYKLLTGTAPYRATSLIDLLHAILTTEPARPSSLRPDIPPALDAIVLCCLQRDRAKRFQTMDELAASLETLLPPTPSRGRPFLPSSSGADTPSPAPIELERPTIPLSAYAHTEILVAPRRSYVRMALGLVLGALFLGFLGFIAFRQSALPSELGAPNPDATPPTEAIVTPPLEPTPSLPPPLASSAQASAPSATQSAATPAPRASHDAPETRHASAPTLASARPSAIPTPSAAPVATTSRDIVDPWQEKSSSPSAPKAPEVRAPSQNKKPEPKVLYSPQEL